MNADERGLKKAGHGSAFLRSSAAETGFSAAAEAGRSVFQVTNSGAQ
jgi:hypothetical protein